MPIDEVQRQTEYSFYTNLEEDRTYGRVINHEIEIKFKAMLYVYFSFLMCLNSSRFLFLLLLLMFI